MVILNAGSENVGGTIEQATINAEQWLKNIHEEGFLEVEMSFVKKQENGNCVFNFTHLITKKTIELVIHGFTDDECKKFIFSPRVYWNGSSTASPEIKDFLDEGFKYRIEFYK